MNWASGVIWQFFCVTASLHVVELVDCIERARSADPSFTLCSFRKSTEHVTTVSASTAVTASHATVDLDALTECALTVMVFDSPTASTVYVPVSSTGISRKARPQLTGVLGHVTATSEPPFVGLHMAQELSRMTSVGMGARKLGNVGTTPAL